MIARLLVVPLLSLVGWFAAPPAAAHDSTTTAHAVATGHGEDVEVVLELEYDLLMKSAWLYADAYEATDRDEQLRQLERNHAEVSAYVEERFQVAYDEKLCPGQTQGPGSITERDGRPFALITVDYDCTGVPGGEHGLYSALFPDDENFVHSTQTVLRYDIDGEQGSAVLDAATPRHDPTTNDGRPAAAADADQAVTPATDGAGVRLWEFGVLGAEHLLLGVDHLLFLLALLIGARRWRDVAVTASAFTIAHSVTLALASLGMVSVPSAVVEPMIAASIVVVALLGLRSQQQGQASRWRLPTAFGFGLLHGLGFAGALGIAEPGSWALLWSLLAFNVGIEVAQLTLLALAFPILLALRKIAAGPRVVTALTVTVAALGSLWLIQRLPMPDELTPLASVSSHVAGPQTTS